VTEQAFVRMVGERIRRLREGRSWSQRMLAGEELTSAFISQVERGLTSPSLSSLAIIARRLGVSPSELLTLDDTDVVADIRFHLLLGQVCCAGGDLERARSSLESSLSLSREHGAQWAEAEAELHMGNACARGGDMHEAIEHLTAALGLFETLEDPPGIASSLLALGKVHLQQHNPLLSIQFCRTVLERFARTPLDGAILAEAEYSLGQAYLALRETSTGAEFIRRARIRLASLCGVKQMARSRLDQALTMWEEGDQRHAMVSLQTSCALAHCLMVASLWVEVNRSSAMIAAKTGDPHEAHDFLETALDAARKAEDVERETHLLTCLARSRAQEERIPEALALADQAFRLAVANHVVCGAGEAAHLKGSVLRKAKRTGEALAAYREALAAYRQANETTRLAEIYGEMGEMFMEEQNEEEALAYFRRASDLFRQISSLNQSPA